MGTSLSAESQVHVCAGRRQAPGTRGTQGRANRAALPGRPGPSSYTPSAGDDMTWVESVGGEGNVCLEVATKHHGVLTFFSLIQNVSAVVTGEGRY